MLKFIIQKWKFHKSIVPSMVTLVGNGEPKKGVNSGEPYLPPSRWELATLSQAR